MDPRFLTDSERRYRSPALIKRYRFWLRFQYKGLAISRWFEDADERGRYELELAAAPACFGVAILERGEATDAPPL